jgi:hypothetical protein
VFAADTFHLSGARFAGAKVWFTNAKVAGGAVSFKDATFEAGEVDFTGATTATDTDMNFTGAKPGQAKIRWDNIPKPPGF